MTAATLNCRVVDQHQTLLLKRSAKVQKTGIDSAGLLSAACRMETLIRIKLRDKSVACGNLPQHVAKHKKTGFTPVFLF
jgi:hypothetical protein